MRPITSTLYYTGISVGSLMKLGFGDITWDEKRLILREPNEARLAPGGGTRSRQERHYRGPRVVRVGSSRTANCFRSRSLTAG